MLSGKAAAQQLPPQAGFERLAFLAEVDAGNMAVLEKVRAFPPEEADKLLRDVIDHTTLRAPEKAAAATTLLGELPGIPELYAKRLAALPPLYENSSVRGLWLRRIERIKKRWALNLLAHYLFDDRSLETRYDAETLKSMLEQSGSATRNRFAAASGLARMCREENLPGKNMHFTTEHDVDLMRQWWLKNANQPDSFFFANAKSTFETLATVRTSLDDTSITPLTAVPNQISARQTGHGSDHLWLWIATTIMAVLGSLWLVIKKRQIRGKKPRAPTQ